MNSQDWSKADAVALEVLRRQGGVARIGAFLDAGLTRQQIAAIFRRGVIERPRNAWYADPALPWQAKHAIRVGGVLTCVTAAATYGLPVPPGSHLKVSVLLQRNAPRVRHNRDKRHYVVPGEDREVETHWSPLPGTPSGWRTPLVDTLLALADCVAIEWWIAALDAALHVPRGGEPMLSQGEFAALAARLPARLRPELDRVDPLAGSCIETLVRLGLVRRKLGPFVLQFSPSAYQSVDFLLPGKLIVEVDGAEFHDPEQDAIRDAYFRRLGYRVLRFTYADVVERLEWVLDQIAAELFIS